MANKKSSKKKTLRSTALIVYQSMNRQFIVHPAAEKKFKAEMKKAGEDMNNPDEWARDVAVDGNVEIKNSKPFLDFTNCY